MSVQKKIGDLTLRSTVDGSEKIEVSASGSFYVLASAIKTFCLAAYAGAVSIVTTGTVTTGVWNARINPRSRIETYEGSPEPNIDQASIYHYTDVTGTLDIQNPIGSPVNGQELTLVFRSEAGGDSIAFSSGYRFSADVPNPGTTSVAKTMYFFFIYNSTEDKWDCTNIIEF